MPHIWPQTLETSATQSGPQACEQQPGSTSQIWVTHLLHSLPSAAPVKHGSCEQTSPPQIPFPQMPLQHCAGDEHIDPFGKQPPQMPSTHEALQHWEGSKQSAPSGMHCWVQIPFTQENEQHSSGAPHFAFSGAQRDSLQIPPTHRPLQQSIGSAQGTPICEQCAGPQKPSTQDSEQHWFGLMHAVPSAAHAVPPHTPPSQLPLQQAPSVEQGSPSPWHCGAAPVPPVPGVPSGGL